MKNTVLEAMKDRRSCRAYKPDPVPAELIEQVAEAGLYAASGRNNQAAMVVAVTDPVIREKLSKANAAVMGAGNDPFYGAPAVLVVLANREFPTYLYDGSLMMGNLLLAADTLGLGSCWIHRAKEVFDEPEWKAWLASLGVEGDWEGIGNCILGWPAADKNTPAPRKENRVVYVK